MSGCTSNTAAQKQVNNLPEDFNGIWQIISWDEVIRPEADESNFTELAKERLAHFKKNL